MEPTPPGEALAWRDPELSPKLLGYNYLEDVSFMNGLAENADR
jgi:salicylate hydroxylase